ncbi:MAG: MBOAT family O-acyltransferase [Rikenellaceae bacterium]
MVDFAQIASRIGELMLFDASQPMIFSSGLFLFLFTAFLFGYWALRGSANWRILYVIAFSLLFYYKSSGIYFLILVAVSICDYWIGHIMATLISIKQRKLLVAVSLVVNLGMLAYFKYTNLFVEFSNSLFGDGLLEFQNIFLPVGISFFVFQSLSYTIDIYRGRLEPLQKWGDYLFYLSFFPQLVAGPIVRATDFIPQIRKPLEVTREMFGSALFLIITGLFKKAVISDYISLNFVDRVFDAPLLYTGFDSLMAIYGYALQIYCDFSGYSDMAIGLALLLGFKFPKNFDAPYKSATITEFWRRWHISLSSWLRDYLYISLGGSRVGRVRTYLNLLITMVLGGLWHGAAVRFILWGTLHGVALALHKVWLSVVPGAETLGSKMQLGWRILGVILTFNIVCFGWLMFRAESMEIVGSMLSQIFTDFGGEYIGQALVSYAPFFGLLVLGFLLHFAPEGWSDRVRGVVTRAPFGAQVAAVVAVIWLVMQVQSSEIQPFIYFQF